MNTIYILILNLNYFTSFLIIFEVMFEEEYHNYH
jgi:hypothetical protein